MQETFHFIPGKEPRKQKLIKMYIADNNNKCLPFIKGILFVIPVLDTPYILFYDALHVVGIFFFILLEKKRYDGVN